MERFLLFRSSTAEYRRGFEACLDLVEGIIGSAKRLKQVKSYLLTVRASMKEKNVVGIPEDLGLYRLGRGNSDVITPIGPLVGQKRER